MTSLPFLSTSFIALFLSLPFLSAQTVRGRITDPDGNAVAGASVEIAESDRGAVTKADGSWEISGLAGPVTVRASYAGFEPVQAAATVPQSGGIEVDLQFGHLRAAITSVEVVGESVESVREVPGAVFVVAREELVRSRPMDANEVLRRVPGVTLREDSGPVAMRLNVAIRGLNPDRSRSVLMLEDGIPIALAPYGEPEMYYSPPINRMSRIEVLKGSGQIVHGPQTVGGVINFVTPDPPASTHGAVELQGGQRGLFSGQASVGGGNRDQTAGWLLNYLHKQGDGFRDLYFDFDDVQAKVTVKPTGAQTLAIKLGAYDEKSNSTYLGLTTPQFLVNPNANSVPSDLLKVRRYSGSLSHTMALNPRLVWSSAVFGYNTVRDWSRQEFDRSNLGRSYLRVDGDPSVPGGAVYLRDVSGNRNRAFRVLGGQTGTSWDGLLANRRNRIDTGVRFLYEEADDQHIDGARFDSRTGALRDDEDRFGHAFSAYLQDRIHLNNRLILTPGVRLERYSYERHILRTRVGGVPADVDIRRGDSVTKVIPGLGGSYQVNSFLTAFAGVHRGFSPPRTKDAITNEGFTLELDAELSWNYEAGARVQAARWLQSEVTFFRMDFSNQIIPGAQSGGAVTTLVNGGATLHQGLESSVRVNWDRIFPSAWAVYTDVRYMNLSTARFSQNRLFGGNRLPYAPRHTFSFLLGARQRRGWGFQIDSSYIGEQFADNNQTLAASADGTVGLIPAFLLWNGTVDYTVQRERVGFTPYFTVKNLTDRVYIASRAPQGIQPGLFRQINAGLRFTF
jgi:Fe(3+) dicitrate transport protein